MPPNGLESPVMGTLAADGCPAVCPHAIITGSRPISHTFSRLYYIRVFKLAGFASVVFFLTPMGTAELIIPTMRSLGVGQRTSFVQFSFAAGTPSLLPAEPVPQPHTAWRLTKMCDLN